MFKSERKYLQINHWKMQSPRQLSRYSVIGCIRLQNEDIHKITYVYLEQKNWLNHPSIILVARVIRWASIWITTWLLQRFTQGYSKIVKTGTRRRLNSTRISVIPNSCHFQKKTHAITEINSPPPDDERGGNTFSTEECRLTNDENNATEMTTLQAVATQSADAKICKIDSTNACPTFYRGFKSFYWK